LKVSKQAEKTTLLLGVLKGLTQKFSEEEIFQMQYPFMLKEAQLSSEIEGTRSTIVDVMKEEKIEEKTDKVFRKGDEKVDKLKEQDVKITLKEALKKVDELKEREYKEGKCEKTIAIIQSINKKTLWNITEITNNFNILNIKITATDGKVIHHACEPVFKFKTPEKKK